MCDITTANGNGIVVTSSSTSDVRNDATNSAMTPLWQVTGVQVVGIGSDYVTVSWNRPDGGATAIDLYQVQYWAAVESASTVSPGTAIAKSGYGDVSDAFVVYTLEPNITVRGLQHSTTYGILVSYNSIWPLYFVLPCDPWNWIFLFLSPERKTDT